MHGLPKVLRRISLVSRIARDGRSRHVSSVLFGDAWRKIRVLLVDDHVAVRASLRQTIEFLPWLEVVAEAGDGAQGLAMARELQPDVVLMDIQMPGVGGLEAAAQLHREAPEIKVLLLSGHPDTRYATRALAVGAVGLLNKDAEPEELWMAVAQAAGASPRVIGKHGWSVRGC